MVEVRIIKQKLSIDHCFTNAKSNSSGAVTLFVGTVRNHSNNKEVIRLDFSSYQTMAEKELNKIAVKAKKLYDLENVIIHHAVGSLNIGDIAVIIAVTAKHRKHTFKACEYCIDTLKETVPIWKKEYYLDDSIWVNSRP